jgi:3-deoxy-D-manno-octulosonic-acid transferase
MVNARLSDKSFTRFLKYRDYVSDILDIIDLVAAGSPGDYQRLRQLGITPSRLHLTGNLKYDRLFQTQDQGRVQEFRAILQGGSRDREAPVFLVPPPTRGRKSLFWRPSPGSGPPTLLSCSSWRPGTRNGPRNWAGC